MPGGGRLAPAQDQAAGLAGRARICRCICCRHRHRQRQCGWDRPGAITAGSQEDGRTPDVVQPLRRLRGRRPAGQHLPVGPHPRGGGGRRRGEGGGAPGAEEALPEAVRGADRWRRQRQGQRGRRHDQGEGEGFVRRRPGSGARRQDQAPDPSLSVRQVCRQGVSPPVGVEVSAAQQQSMRPGRGGEGGSSDVAQQRPRSVCPTVLRPNVGRAGGARPSR